MKPCQSCGKPTDVRVGIVRQSASSIAKSYRTTGIAFCPDCQTKHEQECKDRLAAEQAARARLKLIREEKRQLGLPITDEDYGD